MKLPQLKKAQKLFERIQELDKEIIEIEKSADLIANKKTDIKLTLKVNDQEEKVKDSEKVTLDEDGSLSFGTGGYMDHMRRALYGFSMLPPPSCNPKKECTIKQDYILSDTVAIQVLGVILAEKLEARKLAIKALNKIGVEI